MTLYGVSVGTGDPEDITVKALKTIERCRVIAAPAAKGGRSAALSIAEQAADLTGKEILLLDMPMTRDRQALAAAHRAGYDPYAPQVPPAEETGRTSASRGKNTRRSRLSRSRSNTRRSRNGRR